MSRKLINFYLTQFKNYATEPKIKKLALSSLLVWGTLISLALYFKHSALLENLSRLHSIMSYNMLLSLAGLSWLLNFIGYSAVKRLYSSMHKSLFLFLAPRELRRLKLELLVVSLGALNLAFVILIALVFRSDLNLNSFFAAIGGAVVGILSARAVNAAKSPLQRPHSQKIQPQDRQLHKSNGSSHSRSLPGLFRSCSPLCAEIERNLLALYRTQFTVFFANIIVTYLLYSYVLLVLSNNQLEPIFYIPIFKNLIAVSQLIAFLPPRDALTTLQTGLLKPLTKTLAKTLVVAGALIMLTILDPIIIGQIFSDQVLHTSFESLLLVYVVSLIAATYILLLQELYLGKRLVFALNLAAVIVFPLIIIWHGVVFKRYLTHEY